MTSVKLDRRAAWRSRRSRPSSRISASRSRSTTRPSAGGRGTSTSTSRRSCTTRTCTASRSSTRCSAPSVDAGPVVFELLQPLDGPSIYKEWLEEHGEGLQHIACMRPTREEADELSGHFAGLRRRGADGRPDRRDDPVLLPGHGAAAQGRSSSPGSGHAVDLKPSWVYPRAEASLVVGDSYMPVDGVPACVRSPGRRPPRSSTCNWTWTRTRVGGSDSERRIREYAGSPGRSSSG